MSKQRYHQVDEPDEDDSFPIFLKFMDGTTKIFHVMEGLCVATLKLLVEKKFGIPFDQQPLIFAGKQLEDHAILFDYNISAESTITVMGTLAGGAGKKVLKKDKGTRMLEHDRAIKSLTRQAAEASNGFQGLVQSVTGAIDAFKRSSQVSLIDVLKHLPAPALERLNTSLQSNNQEHKIATLAREVFADSYNNIMAASHEVESLKALVLVTVTDAFDREFFGENGSYDMVSYSKLIVKAMTGDVDMDLCLLHPRLLSNRSAGTLPTAQPGPFQPLSRDPSNSLLEPPPMSGWRGFQ